MVVFLEGRSYLQGMCFSSAGYSNYVCVYILRGFGVLVVFNSGKQFYLGLVDLGLELLNSSEISNIIWAIA